MVRSTYSVLSTLAASAGDITQAKGFLSITGCPSMKYSLIRDAGNGYQLQVTEYVGSITVTPTAAASTEFTITVTQFNAAIGRNVTEVASYTTAASGDTATTICNAWRAQLNAFATLNIAVTGSATLIVTADASVRSAIINVAAVTAGIAVASTAANYKAIVSSTDATPIVVTTAAGTYVVGQLITIAEHLTNVAANGTFLITATNGTTTVTLGNQYTGANVAGSGAGAGGATGNVAHGAFSVLAAPSTTNIWAGNQSRGSYLDLIAAGVSSALISSTKTYNTIVFDYNARSSNSVAGNSSEEENIHTLYVQDDATNFANFRTRINEVCLNYTASSTVSDPQNLEIVN